ncbi:hypothetical protein [Flectobacillus roseus]|uniref:hypothetical protein n=1 Tax=Flectobacillus roseus TaxID=502259 RepID=UPI0024B7CDDB|nr:hypothetical protein [Flectobacillus roseus]MDI9870563.1 hypothetical protein [Flectobacillus roseus]
MAINLKPGAVGLIYSPGQTWDLDIYLLDAFDAPFAIGDRKVTAVIESNGIVLETMTAGSGLTIANNNIKLVKDMTTLTVTGSSAIYNPQLDNVPLGQFKMTLRWENAGKDQPLMIFLIDVNSDVQEREAGISSGALGIICNIINNQVSIRLKELSDTIANGSILNRHLSENSVDYENMAFMNIEETSEGGFVITALGNDGRRKKVLQMSQNALWKMLLDPDSIQNESIAMNKFLPEVQGLINMIKMFSVESFPSGEHDIFTATVNGTDGRKKKLFSVNSKAELKSLFDFSLRKIREIDIDSNLFFGYKHDFDPEKDKYILELTAVDKDGRKKYLLGVEPNGKISGIFEIKNKSVGEEHIKDSILNRLPSDLFIKQNSQNNNDYLISDNQDDNYSTESFDFPIYTDPVGSLFKRLAPLKTKSITIFNNTASVIEVNSKGSFLTIKGKNFRNSYTPIVNSKFVSYKGWFLYNSTQLPQNPTLGDYYLCMFFYNVAKTTTIQGITFSEWDILYYDGIWKVQQCPSSSATLQAGDYFDITQQGQYWKTDLSQNDKLVFLGIKAGGGWNEPIFIKQKSSDFFFRGICNPNTFSTNIMSNTDLYIVGQSGNIDGISVQKGDYVYKDNGFIGIQKNEIVSIPVGYSYSFAVNNTNELSVRRADLGAKVSLQAKAKINTKLRQINDDMVCVSDSMFGANVWQNIVPLFPTKNVAIESYGGADSNNILAMLKKLLYEKVNYAGYVFNFWHGQNNDTDLTQIKEVALEFASLVSNENYKFTMWSMLGNMDLQWNGNRFICPVHENAFSGNINSVHFQVENFYDLIFKGKHFPTRKKALEASANRTRRHLQFPYYDSNNDVQYLTEGQVSQQYGIPALSYFFDFTSVTWSPEDLRFTGYHSSSGLPTGGNNLDYKLRNGNGTMGNILVKENGIWIEKGYDHVHPSNEGGAAIAQKFKEFYNKLNY